MREALDAARPRSSASPGRSDELERVRERYERRARAGLAARYAPLLPENLYASQRRAWLWTELLRSRGRGDLGALRVLEVGCGTGAVLQQLAALGVAPHRLHGAELLSERCRLAAGNAPGASVVQADAGQLPFGDGCMDMVVQSTVFSSILDDGSQRQLAAEMLRVVHPDGVILWCDLRVDNPRNRDVRGVGLRRLRALFPGARVTARRGILLMPLARRLRFGLPAVGLWLELLPPLCGHLLACIEPAAAPRPTGASSGAAAGGVRGQPA